MTKPALTNIPSTPRIGIDLGGTKTEGIILAPDGKTLARERVPTPAANGYDAVLRNMVALVQALEHKANPQKQGLPPASSWPIGIGTPGTIDTDGRMKNANTVCLNGKPLPQDLAIALNQQASQTPEHPTNQQPTRPIRIANDANCFALSEATDGAATGAPVVFGVILGTGVGGGIVINGQVLSGRSGIAGEWGHTTLLPNGPRCYCGKQGCVEALLSGPALAAAYRQAQTSSGTQASRPAQTDQDLTAQAIAQGAQEGDPIAQQVIAQAMTYFGGALATVINILDPHIIVLGGGLSNMPQWYTSGTQAVANQVFNSRRQSPAATSTTASTTHPETIAPPIKRAKHGDSSGVRGAAWLNNPTAR